MITVRKYFIMTYNNNATYSNEQINYKHGELPSLGSILFEQQLKYIYISFHQKIEFNIFKFTSFFCLNVNFNTLQRTYIYVVLKNECKLLMM